MAGRLASSDEAGDGPMLTFNHNRRRCDSGGPRWHAYGSGAHRKSPGDVGPDDDQRWPRDEFLEREGERGVGAGAGGATPGGRAIAEADRECGQKDAPGLACPEAEGTLCVVQDGSTELGDHPGGDAAGGAWSDDGLSHRTCPLVLLADADQDDVLDLEAEQLERRRQGLQWAFVTTTVAEYLKAYKIAADYEDVKRRRVGSEQHPGAASSSGGAAQCSVRHPCGSGVLMEKREEARQLFHRADEIAAERAEEVSSTESPSSAENGGNGAVARPVAIAPVFDLDPNLGRRRIGIGNGADNEGGVALGGAANGGNEPDDGVCPLGDGGSGSQLSPRRGVVPKLIGGVERPRGQACRRRVRVAAAATKQAVAAGSGSSTEDAGADEAPLAPLPRYRRSVGRRTLR